MGAVGGTVETGCAVPPVTGTPFTVITGLAADVDTEVLPVPPVPTVVIFTVTGGQVIVGGGHDSCTVAGGQAGHDTVIGPVPARSVSQVSACCH